MITEERIRQVSADLIVAAIDLEQLRADPRDPSQLIHGKLDAARAMRRAARALQGRE